MNHILPVSVLSIPEQDLLTEHYKSYLAGKVAKDYTLTERKKIARLYDRAKLCGYFPADIDRYGRLVYAKARTMAVA